MTVCTSPPTAAAPENELIEREGMTLTPEARAYYADVRLWRTNVAWLMIGSLAGGLCMEVADNQISLYMASIGMSVGLIGFAQSLNRWAVAFLVLYFSWKSDNCQMRMGRRKPFILLSLLPIALGLIILPHTTNYLLVIVICMSYWFFLDMKMSTYPFLNWDISPKSRWGLITGLNTSAYGCGRLIADLTVIPMAKTHGYAPALLIAALAVTLPTTLLLLFLKEPPLRVANPQPFRIRPILRVGFSRLTNWALFAGYALAAGAIAIPIVLFPLQLRASGFDEQQIGLTLQWGNWAHLVLAPIGGLVVDKLGALRTFLVSLLFYAVGTGLGVAATDSQFLFSLCWGLTKGAYVLFSISLIIFLIEGVPLTIIASFCACNAMFNNASSAVMISLSSFLVARLNNQFQAGWILGFVLTLIGFPILLWVAKRRRTETATT